MMANWDLTDLRRDLPGLKAKVLLIVGENDKAVPPRDAGVVAAEIPGAIVETIRRAGHLAHEERPDEVCRIIMRYAADCGSDRGGGRLDVTRTAAFLIFSRHVASWTRVAISLDRID